MTPTLPLVFLAGLLSFLSPCVLPLVPSYLAYVGGSSAETASRAARRRVTLRNSLLFILGFSLIFILLGASASALGGLLRDNRAWLMTIGGVLVLLFGLMMLGVFKLPFLYREARLSFRGSSSTPAGALLLGMAFAAGWTPCIGPVLGAILTFAAAASTLTHGVALLTIYALGLAIPFFLAALALESFLHFSQGFRRYLPWVERSAGALLVIAGLLLITGSYTALNGYLVKITPAWLWSHL
jgi:cytochrome c-type biogenesis protein